MSSEDHRHNRKTPRNPLIWIIGLAIVVAIIAIVAGTSVELIR